MRNTIYFNSLFFFNLLWTSASHPMHLVTKQGMTPNKAVKKCINDGDHQGLKELLAKTDFADCKNIKKIKKRREEAKDISFYEGEKFGDAISRPYILALIASIFVKEYFEVGIKLGRLFAVSFSLASVYTYKKYDKVSQAEKNFELLHDTYKDTKHLQ